MKKEKQDELIYRDALLAAYDAMHKGEPGRARKLIEDAPTVDAVPVVRCKDCKSRNYQECAADGVCWCDMLERFTWENFFCADGERRGGND